MKSTHLSISLLFICHADKEKISNIIMTHLKFQALHCSKIVRVDGPLIPDYIFSKTMHLATAMQLILKLDICAALYFTDLMTMVHI